MRPMSARSRSPMMESVLIESKRSRASSARSTGVFPRFTTYFGPRTEDAGFTATIWPVTRKSKSIRIAARCCFTVGAAAGWFSIYAATTTGLISISLRMRCFSHQLKNCMIAWAYAVLVFRFLIVAVKNSTKRQAAASPARVIAAGKLSNPARERSRWGIGTRLSLMGAAIHDTSGSQIPRDRKNRQGQYRCQSEYRPQSAFSPNQFPSSLADLYDFYPPRIDAS